jgi:uncharacterized phage protein gp47/JayE
VALEYKTPQQIADQYLLWLKTLKPEVNTSQVDSDWNIRGQVVGGVFSGLYADQRKSADDAFPQSARREALLKHLDLYFNEGFTPATVAIGSARVSGALNTLYPVGTQFQYDPNGNVYVATEAVQLDESGTGIVPVQSISTGQDQNLLEGAPLSLPAPPVGSQPTAIVFDGPISDGRNVESNEQAAARILRQVRTPLAGGKISDYEQFALDADPSVTSANILRFPFGFGTVGVVITAGTSDIDQAIDNVLPIILIPSDELVERVQDYIETQNPTTDCATVLKPASVPIDCTAHVRYASGDGTKEIVVNGVTFTQEALVVREIGRAIYKTPPGGRQFGATGFVVASEIEEVLDTSLGDEPYTLGSYAQILVDRQVEDLSATGPNRALNGNEVPVPGTITVLEM